MLMTESTLPSALRCEDPIKILTTIGLAAYVQRALILSSIGCAKGTPADPHISEAVGSLAAQLSDE